ncbi:GTP-binding protein ERG [Citrus sinensis]|uniref:GTP-binding protein ERG n=1 Tax=Citrus sinensis TaxID=2711 RepID=A0ACB8NC93_CITSI|nr:GTP-binding protein ERG [Citrus sinensis]
MKALRALRTLAPFAEKPNKPRLNPLFIHRFYSAQPQQTDNETENDCDSVFDSSYFRIPTIDDPQNNNAAKKQEPTWDEKYRERTDRIVFGEEAQKGKLRIFQEEEEERKHRALAKALLQAALERQEEEEEEVKEEDQKSVAVGIIGAPNAGKSSIINYMVGTKVAAVSRKTNTTTHEVLGVMTKADTQICIFDTPGLMLNKSGYSHKDVKVRVESAWSAVNLFEVLMVVFDVHRHLTSPDSRVIRLIERMGKQAPPKQKRVLCMNKVDLVTKKKDLLKVAEQFKHLPGYERIFMTSGLKGAGLKDLTQYLMEQACFHHLHFIWMICAVQRPWSEDPLTMSEEVMKNISLEVVRERLLDHVHQEIPYSIEHRLIDWKDLRDGSLRIEQHLITNKLSQRKILVGKNGSKIGAVQECRFAVTKEKSERMLLCRDRG